MCWELNRLRHKSNVMASALACKNLQGFFFIGFILLHQYSFISFRYKEPMHLKFYFTYISYTVYIL